MTTATIPPIQDSLDLTEEQTMIRDMVREFARAELAPIAAEIDETHTFPRESWNKLVDLGLTGLPFPESVGGSAAGTLAYVIAVEEISRICGSTGLTLAAHVSLGTYPIFAWGGPELCEQYVPALIRGDYLGAYGLTEPGAGSDSGGTRTTAVLDGDHYVLNGRKCFITNANHAGVFICTAVTDKSLGPKGISAFVVPRDIDGFSLEKGEEKLGMRGSDWASLVFEDARIPRDHLLGPEGEGFLTFMKTLDGGRISIGALALGLAQGAYDEAKKHAYERIAFGGPGRDACGHGIALRQLSCALCDAMNDMVGVLCDAAKNGGLPLVHPRQAEKEKSGVVRGRAALLDRVAAVTVQVRQVDECLVVELVPRAVDDGGDALALERQLRDRVGLAFGQRHLFFVRLQLERL